jgi:hypothetical protein
MGEFSMALLLALAHRESGSRRERATLRTCNPVAKTMTTPLQRFLGNGDAFARFRDHAQRLLRLQSMFVDMIGEPLSHTCSVANLKGETLVVLAKNGAAAVRLKQIAPRLVEQFAARGILIKEIQVKIAVDNPAPDRTPRSERVLSDAGRASLAALSDSLPADAPLRASLLALIERSRPQR